MFVPDWTEFVLDESPRSRILIDHLRTSWPDRLWPESLERLSPRIAKLPFYHKAELFTFQEVDLPAPNERYFLIDDEDAVTLNWTNQPIYATNERDGMRLTPKTLISYAKFFFHMVRGQLGRFIIVETPDELLWLSDEARERGLAAIAEENISIGPVAYLGPDATGALHMLRCHVQFKNGLFRTDIYTAPYETDVFDPELGAPEHFTLGQMKLTNEDLLLEELEVKIDAPPGEFELWAP